MYIHTTSKHRESEYLLRLRENFLVFLPCTILTICYNSIKVTVTRSNSLLLTILLWHTPNKLPLGNSKVLPWSSL